jgi:hypothetical protein
MSSTNSPTLIIDLRSRVPLRLAVPVLCAGACAPFLLTSPGVAQATLAVGICALVLGIGLWRAGWLGGPRRLVRICWHADGRWLLTDARNRTFEGVLHGDTRVGARYVWLRWATPERSRLAHRSLLLIRADMLPAPWRRLIVRLHIDGPPPAAAMTPARQVR